MSLQGEPQSTKIFMVAKIKKNHLFSSREQGNLNPSPSYRIQDNLKKLETDFLKNSSDYHYKLVRSNTDSFLFTLTISLWT